VRLPQARLDQVLGRFHEIEARMSAASDGSEIVRLSREHAELKPVVEAVHALDKVRSEAPELEEMAASGDADMSALARDELEGLRARLPELERQVALLLAPRDRDENASAILEVRAGTGGDEAALFAGDLFRMYQRYAALHGWRIEIDSVSEGEVGGYKEIIAAITGDGVFGRLKFESGVHRVQRVPETEAGGRIHTSAATVAVLPEAEEVDFELKSDEVRIEVCRSSGAGGQGVNTTDSAVQVLHIPTGTIVRCQDGRSQIKNKEKALTILRSRLLERRQQEEAAKYSAHRRSLIGSGGREEKIRTYNYPQNRVSDHRIECTLYNLTGFMEGKIDEMTDRLLASDLQERLAEAGLH